MVVRRFATVVAVTTLLGGVVLVAGQTAAGAIVTLHANPSNFASVLAIANADNRGDTVVMAPGTYEGPITITGRLSLIGHGANNTVITGSGGAAVVDVSPSTELARVTISQLTITGGVNTQSSAGGLENDDATVALDRVVVTNNNSDATGAFIEAGGIANFGIMTTTGGAVTANTAVGGFACAGGIWNTGVLTMHDTGFSRNTCAGDYTFGVGGVGTGNFGEAVPAGGRTPRPAQLPGQTELIAVATTITNNTSLPNSDPQATGQIAAGAMFNLGDLQLSGATLGANTSDGLGLSCGGGLCNLGTAQVVNTQVTSNIAGNNLPGNVSAGGGIGNGGTLTTKNVNLANNNALGDGLGGGLFNDCSAVASLVSSTVNGNFAGADGGGIGFVHPVSRTNTTVTSNSPDNVASVGSECVIGF